MIILRIFGIHHISPEFAGDVNDDAAGVSLIYLAVVVQENLLTGDQVTRIIFDL